MAPYVRWWSWVGMVGVAAGIAVAPAPVTAQQSDSDQTENNQTDPSGADEPVDGASGDESAEPMDEEASDEEGDGSGDEATDVASGTEGEDGDDERGEPGDPTVDEQVSGPTFEVDEVVERARTNSDLLAEFEAKRDQAEWKAYRAKWAPAPKIESLTTVAPVPAQADPDRLQNNFDEIGSLNIGPFVSHSLDLVVPVYTFGRISKFRELADVGIDVTELKRREAQLNAAFQTKRAFYSLRLAQTFKPLLEEGDRRIEQKLDDMEEARAFGEADFSTEDYRKLEIFSTEVDSRIVDNAKLADVAKSGLQYLAELEADHAVVEPYEQGADPKKLASYRTYLQAAREHRPDLQQLERALEARQLQVGIEQSKIYPEVFVSTGMRLGWSTEETAKQPVCERFEKNGRCFPESDRAEGLFAEPDVDPLNRFSLRVGLGLRWNIDPLGRHGQIQEQQAKLEALRAQKRRAEGAVSIELRKKFRDAADQLEKIGIYERRLTAARRWRDQLGLSIEAAGVESDDAIDPLKAYYQALAQYYEARYNYLVARAALAQAVGVTWLDRVESDDQSIDAPSAPEVTGQGGNDTD